ncbi:hypothetical protein Taro_047245 [Colocasia esculenta]|uniref:DOG1 domain-containing protein n=1 Tax=Colocasia esculenta TaxID=4460 RepID=A0A843X6Y5_COLES|nr:hypothetical protein [Colocasia esculenta]
MEAFFEGWLQRQEELLHELLAVRSDDGPCDDDDDRLRELISCTLAHCKAYYREKARLADRDVLLVYSPTWLTPFERTFLWVAGFRPSLVFRLLRAAVGADGNAGGATPEKALALEVLEADIAEEERKLTREMAGLQEAMALLQVVAMVRRAVAARNGHTQANEDEVVGPLVRSLRLLLAYADRLRVRLVKRLVEILRPAQMADLLVAAWQLHLRIRGWGMRGRGAAGRAAA